MYVIVVLVYAAGMIVVLILTEEVNVLTLNVQNMKGKSMGMEMLPVILAAQKKGPPDPQFDKWAPRIIIIFVVIIVGLMFFAKVAKI
jgi:hypothetical protein